MVHAIRIKNLRKIFSIDRERNSMFRTLEKKVLWRHRTSGTFVALNDINIDILIGERIGVVGNNGSGKTTLLKVIAGLYESNGGEIHVNGNLSLLAGFGIGMVDELSVEENIFLYGAIYGIERNRIKERLHEIIEWAELESFARAKLKTLSSGMRTRLAFSATRYIETDTYLLDEALSAGDKNFKQKCEQFFEKAKDSDRTFMVATHDLNFVRLFCEKTLWLHKGEQMAFGKTDSVLGRYMESKST